MDKELLLNEIQYKAVRSSGAGGQNVNKVASKVIASINMFDSKAFTDEEKVHVLQKLKTKISQEGILALNAETDRSQLKNKEIVTQKLIELIQKALIIPKKRKPTNIPTAINEKRIKEKKANAETKQNRKKPNF